MNYYPLCPRCGKHLVPSDLSDYEYLCLECDENFYNIEVTDYTDIPMEPVATYGLCNVASVNIYHIRYGIDDAVLAGVNDNEPQWCEVRYDEEPVFMLGLLKVPLNECMLLKGE